jgi:zinc transporter 1
MGLSREARIITLLVIDTAFFFLELIVGYAVGSLALVADSFHMLNDVLSRIVALFTIKLATSPSSAANSYGWQRAEILGALINGVFLIALCASIGVEAVGRLISPPEITNPKLIVAVGSAGLLSNIVGLFLFHDHGHGHGHDHGHDHGAISLPADDDEPLHPEAEPIPRRRSDSLTFPYQHPAETRAQIIEAARLGASYEAESYTGSPRPAHHRMSSNASRRRSRPLAALKAPQPGTNETIAPQPREAAASSSTPTTDNTAVDEPVSPKTVPTPKHAPDADAAERGNGHSHDHDHDHDHKPARQAPTSGHSHGSMNMRGVFLHVLGDALGNVGVISAGLVIWFFQGSWTLLFDPAVSLLITCIIFSSAMPLVRSASKILMQGVPEHVSLEAVRESIKAVDGVVSVHDLHVWQLSETTTVASVHVLIEPDKDYMEVASNIRQELHSHGIHSVTIQPEFYNGSETISDSGDEGNTCLIRCPPEQCAADTCCPTTAPPSQPRTPRLDHVSEGDEGSNHSH